MTSDEILAMEPGRALDALVADKVMGWKLADYKFYLAFEVAENVFTRVSEFEPSIDIRAAWEIWEHMKAKDKWIDFCIELEEQFANTSCYIDVMAEINPLNICRSALLAVMEDK